MEWELDLLMVVLSLVTGIAGFAFGKLHERSRWRRRIAQGRVSRSVGRL